MRMSEHVEWTPGGFPGGQVPGVDQGVGQALAGELRAVDDAFGGVLGGGDRAGAVERGACLRGRDPVGGLEVLAEKVAIQAGDLLGARPASSGSTRQLPAVTWPTRARTSQAAQGVAARHWSSPTAPRRSSNTSSTRRCTGIGSMVPPVGMPVPGGVRNLLTSSSRVGSRFPDSVIDSPVTCSDGPRHQYPRHHDAGHPARCESGRGRSCGREPAMAQET
jgi:hypothetical protein